jgi:hypothetical protein
MAEKAALAGVGAGSPLVGGSEVNAIPLGIGALGPASGSRLGKAKARGGDSEVQAEEEENEEEEEERGMEVDRVGKWGVEGEEDRVMMASLRNKNKKKGFFKQSMMRGLSDGSKAKIVFDEQQEQKEVEAVVTAVTTPVPAPAPVASTSSNSLGSQNQNRNRNGTRARLVPPSELQERGMVPRNLFVTSVDVEEGMWGDTNATNSSKKRKKDKGKKKEHAEEYWGEAYYDGGGGDKGQFADAEEEEIVLDYGDESGGGTKEIAKVGEEVWKKAEVGWNNYVIVVGKEQVGVGALVGWKVRDIIAKISGLLTIS